MRKTNAPVMVRLLLIVSRSRCRRYSRFCFDASRSINKQVIAFFHFEEA